MYDLLSNAQEMFHSELNKINSFIDDAGKNAASFLPQSVEKIAQFFSDLSSFIDNYQLS
jgi:hypothetical protein